MLLPPWGILGLPMQCIWLSSWIKTLWMSSLVIGNQQLICGYSLYTHRKWNRWHIVYQISECGFCTWYSMYVHTFRIYRLGIDWIIICMITSSTFTYWVYRYCSHNQDNLNSSIDSSRWNTVCIHWIWNATCNRTCGIWQLVILWGRHSTLIMVWYVDWCCYRRNIVYN